MIKKRALGPGHQSSGGGIVQAVVTKSEGQRHPTVWPDESKVIEYCVFSYMNKISCRSTGSLTRLYRDFRIHPSRREVQD